MEERRIMRSGSASEGASPLAIVLLCAVVEDSLAVSIEDVVGGTGSDEVGFRVGNVSISASNSLA
jgi:hypothetical protein